MAQDFDRLEPKHIAFIKRQHLFFTASAAASGHINISPRSTALFRVLDPETVCYLDLTGSGNETAAHLLADGRMTILFTALSGPPLILRLYGRGVVLGRGEPGYEALRADAFAGPEPQGARQIVQLQLSHVKSSCGYGVPLMQYEGERDTLERWTDSKGEDGIRTYWEKKNLESMDGFDTGMRARLSKTPKP
jgi:hypothetical protein